MWQMQTYWEHVVLLIETRHDPTLVMEPLQHLSLVLRGETCDTNVQMAMHD